jgi:uncharacterized protein with HEPN domain
MRPESAALLWDALDAAKSIIGFLDGVTVEEYLDELLRRRAVERGFEIVGEALGRLRRVDPETAERVPGLKDAVGLRNVLIHTGEPMTGAHRLYEKLGFEPRPERHHWLDGQHHLICCAKTL